MVPSDTADVAEMRHACRAAAGAMLRFLDQWSPPVEYVSGEYAHGGSFLLWAKSMHSRMDALHAEFALRCAVLADALEEAGNPGEAAAARADWRVKNSGDGKKRWTVMAPNQAVVAAFLGSSFADPLRLDKRPILNRFPILIFPPLSLRILRWGVIGPVKFTFIDKRSYGFRFDDEVHAGGFLSMFHPFAPDQPALVPAGDS